jgi:flavin-dependent dehydrogenase
MRPEKTEILVIGGGPAGSTFGTFMKMRGHQVTLLEKDRHPRFHIGESLLPMNLPIMERMGVLGKIRAIGVPKMGADFSVPGAGGEYNTYHFARALGDSPDHAFEVRRSEFDQTLFEHCKTVGVEAYEGYCVTSVTANEDGGHLVVANDSDGKEHAWEAGFLVDASGRDTFLSGRNGWKKRNPRHASAAIFGHFKGVKRRLGADQGNISIYWFDHGWIWMIPLQNDVMSIGAVCRPEHLKTRQGSLDEFLLQTVTGVPEVRLRLEGAAAILPAQATGNYSYLSDRMYGPGFLLIGDAYAFIDPVFSSGVYLAMNGAERAVEVAEAWLSSDPRAFARAARKYEADSTRGLGAFSWFIYRFTTPAMRYLMSNPRDIFQVVQGVISLLAGDVFYNPRVRARLWVFRFIYSVAWMLNRPQRSKSQHVPDTH